MQHKVKHICQDLCVNAVNLLVLTSGKSGGNMEFELLILSFNHSFKIQCPLFGLKEIPCVIIFLSIVMDSEISLSNQILVILSSL